jgi:hypothetical protein
LKKLQIVVPCPSGFRANAANSLIGFGKLAVNVGNAAVLSGGALIAGGAIASATGVGAEVGAPAMAAGGLAATYGGAVSLVGIGAQEIGGLINAFHGNENALVSSLSQGAAALANWGIDRALPGLPALFPVDPVGANTDRIADNFAGTAQCQ